MEYRNDMRDRRVASAVTISKKALAMLLVLNNSGLQLMPTTVMALRSAAGAANPADIWLPALLSSGAATVCGCGLMWLLNRRKWHG